MLKQLDRLKVIYNFLKQNRADANDILNYLKQFSTDISLRQLQRDMIEIENIFLHSEEILKVTIGSYRKKIWEIQLKETENILTQTTINNLYLAILTKPNILKESDKDFRNLFIELFQKRLYQGKKEILALKNQQLINSHFYETTKDIVFYSTIDFIIDAVINNRKIQILELANDYSVDNFSFITSNITFSPSGIIYHRGTFFVSGVENKKNEVVVYEISQFKKIRVLKNGYNFEFVINKVQVELKKRFGITKNINEEVYDIEIEFSSVTGSLASKYSWHSTQHFVKKGNVWVMTLHCGINRELVGWLFQWMYNVRIVQPPILQEYYYKALEEMLADRKSNKPLVYRNIFEPIE